VEDVLHESKQSVQQENTEEECIKEEFGSCILLLD
jgi:hypothetical protein